MKGPLPRDRVCLEPGCGAGITRMSKTGYCRPHATARMHASPDYQAARRAGLERHYADPAVRKATGERLASGLERWRASMSEEDRARFSEHGRWLVREYLSKPEVRARALSPEARQRSTTAYVDRVMGWCPVELRPAYHELIRRKRFPAAEARRIIEAEIEGTLPHAQREIANRQFASRLRHERDQQAAY